MTEDRQKKNSFPVNVSLLVYIVVIFALALFLTRKAAPSPKVPDNQTSNRPISQQLEECLPKSGQRSHEICTQLIATIDSFEECVEAGFPIRESNPPSCGTPDGRNFSDLSFQPLDPAITPEEIKMSGKMTCLPHKQTEGPITLECAFGLQTADSKYYALDMSYADPDSQSAQTAWDNVIVEGVLVTPGKISSNQWFRYDIQGIITVKSIRKA